MSRWAICDLKCLDAVKDGQCPGWAYRSDAGFLANACGWMESRNKQWAGAIVETQVISTCSKGPESGVPWFLEAGVEHSVQ